MQVFDAAAVARRTPFEALVPALRRAFELGAEVPPRHAHALGEAGTALLMPAWRVGDGGRYGVKVVHIFPGNTARGLPGVHGLFNLFDANTGVPLAVMDGGELTARRTAAASALAASYLARGDASRLLVVGAGRVAALMPLALRAVRPGLARVDVWARRPAAARALAAQWRGHGFDANAATDLEAAVRRCDIASCATMATTALIQGAWLAPGTHVDLVGSFSPGMREADGECFRRAAVWVDTEEALAKSGDLLCAMAEGCFERAQLQGTLTALVRGQCPARRDAAAVTLFKSVGYALEDLAAAELVFDGPG